MKFLMTILLLMTRGLFSQFDATIPVLDLNDYLNSETKPQFLSTLYEAFTDVGFFAVINTNVEKEVLDAAYNAAAIFFAQPLEEKLLAFDPQKAGERGYTAGESAKGHLEMDYKEFYSIGREVPSEDQERLNLWDNLWPSSCDLKTPFSALYPALEKHKIILEAAIAESLGIEPTFFSKMTNEGDILLRAIHYPKSPPQGQFWAAEHTDIGLFTILPAPTAAGLQVLNSDGQWIDVIVPENAFIINVQEICCKISLMESLKVGFTVWLQTKKGMNAMQSHSLFTLAPRIG